MNIIDSSSGRTQFKPDKRRNCVWCMTITDKNAINNITQLGMCFRQLRGGSATTLVKPVIDFGARLKPAHQVVRWIMAKG
jgi:hypothetical protein